MQYLDYVFVGSVAMQLQPFFGWLLKKYISDYMNNIKSQINWIYCWYWNDIQSVGSSVPVVSRWLWPGNRTFLVVASTVVTWWIVAFCAVLWHHTNHRTKKKTVTTMLTYPWKCTVLHCNHLGNTWKPLVLMTRHFDCCPSASDVKLYISRGRLAWWLLAFLHSEWWSYQIRVRFHTGSVHKQYPKSEEKSLWNSSVKLTFGTDCIWKEPCCSKS